MERSVLTEAGSRYHMHINSTQDLNAIPKSGSDNLTPTTLDGRLQILYQKHDETNHATRETHENQPKAGKTTRPTGVEHELFPKSVETAYLEAMLEGLHG